MAIVTRPFPGQCQCFPFAPPLARSSAVFRHGFRVLLDALSMKCRLREQALPAMKISFTGQQPVTHQPLHLPHPQALHKIPLATSQNFLDIVGVIQEQLFCGAEFEAYDIAVFAYT